MKSSRFSLAKSIALTVAALCAFSDVIWCPAQTAPAKQKQSAALDTLLSNKEYPEFERELSRVRLPQVERDYFQAVLYNHQNRVAESRALLEKTIPRLKDRKQIETALETLADDYQKLSRYADAARVLSDVVIQYSNEIEAARQKDVGDSLHTVELLKGAPAQTVTIGGKSTVPIRRNRFGLLEVPVLVGGRTEWWLFDTGAGMTAITTSTAKRLGLQISAGQANTQGATGARLAMRATIIPSLSLGNAELRNVAAIVLDDSSLAIPLPGKEPYQIEGIVGYPVMAALGSVTFFGSEKMVIGGDALPTSISFPMYVDANTPLVAAKVDGRELVFSLDTGANESQFTVKYYKAFQDVLASGHKFPFSYSGAGGVKQTQVYRQENVGLGGEGGAIRLGDIAVMTEAAGLRSMDDYYGNLGQDVLRRVGNFMLDFRSMRLRVSRPPQ